MSKVSIVAFLVGGAFLNLAYWDVPYYLFVSIAVARWVVQREVTLQQSELQSGLMTTADGTGSGRSVTAIARAAGAD